MPFSRTLNARFDAAVALLRGALSAGLAAAALSGCASPAPPPRAAVPLPPVVVAVPVPVPRIVETVRLPEPVVEKPDVPPPAIQMLAYADRIRGLSNADLTAEIARLADPADPGTQMQLALALSGTRVPADLARALGLMQRVIGNPSSDAQPLQPLARALAARYMEQRRVEDDRDRQAQQLREAQRRIGELNDRMEALRAIERSFGRPSTPAAPAAASPPSAAPAGNGKAAP
ncbi:MAG: hypothetical protein EOO24_07670 [Comamonadaceae bacterium]|nr:MAG: hypothetical protein EOO24_07670 [Comamonadaceae bacterium]